MARIFTDGAESGNTSFFTSVTDPFTASTTRKRSGSYAYYWNYGFGAYGYYLIPDTSEFYLRFGINPDVNNSQYILGFKKDTTDIGSIFLNSNPAAYLSYVVASTIVGTTTISVAIDAWSLVELYVKIADAPNGRAIIKIDGIECMNFTGDTKPGADTTVNGFYLGCYKPGGGGSAIYMDDIALNDTTGGVDNSWCGDGRVILLQPNANGDSSQLVGQDSDSTDNYLNVDEIPADSDTTYNESSTLNEYDLYNLSSPSLSEVTILRVFPIATAKDTVAEGGLASLPISISGGGVYEGTDRVLLTTYTQILGSGGSSGYLKNPYTNLDWTLEDLENLQVGFKVRS